jgi:predicted secreted hydrolase
MASLLFGFSQVVTVASRRVEVRDRQHQVIGEAWIPHDYGSDTFTGFCFMALSGIQFWTIWLVGKQLSSEEKQ